MGSNQQASQRLHVAVIGAGPGGLAACHHLLENADSFTFTCYEQCEAIGGAWLYKPATNHVKPLSNDDSSHACIYDNLRTNLPLETMSFSDFGFTAANCQVKSLPSFVMHDDVLRYLQAYCDHFRLAPHIKFSRRVTSVELVAPHPQKFRVTTVTSGSADSATSSFEIFDAVMICSGHYSKPKWPKTFSIDFGAFHGQIMHSKFYRRAAQFPAESCRKIVIMGGGPSGIDVAFDLEANLPENVEIFLACHTNRTATKFHDNIAGSRVQLKPDIIRATGPGTIEYADGTKEDGVDVIIMCTGYHFDFPFLDDNLTLNNDNQRLTPLYQHLLHIEHPNLCFVGLPTTALPVPMCDLQARYFIAMLKKQFTLPSREEMLKLAEEDYRLRTVTLGWPHRYAHKMGPLLKEYFDALSKESGAARVDSKVFDFFDITATLRAVDPVGYKTTNLCVDKEGKIVTGGNP